MILFIILIELQFGYCTLNVWLFHSRNLKNKLNHLHERALRTVYRNYDCPYKDLLKMDQSVSIHQRSIQYSSIKLCKVKQSPLTKMTKNIIQMRDNKYNSNER